MSDLSFETYKSDLKTYFDKTASRQWVQLTSNSPVSKIRETVRNGRKAMQQVLLGYLPIDLTGCRILDAGCGTGMLAIECARRGADVIAIDISPSLVAEAEKRMPMIEGAGTITWLAGDMADPTLGRFDYVIAMDSVIHYPLDVIADLIEGWAERTERAVLVTYAPSNPMLLMMKAVGKLFPRKDRSPRINPISEKRLSGALNARLGDAIALGRTDRISTGFYKSQALEVMKK